MFHRGVASADSAIKIHYDYLLSAQGFIYRWHPSPPIPLPRRQSQTAPRFWASPRRQRVGTCNVSPATHRMLVVPAGTSPPCNGGTVGEIRSDFKFHSLSPSQYLGRFNSMSTQIPQPLIGCKRDTHAHECCNSLETRAGRPYWRLCTEHRRTAAPCARGAVAGAVAPHRQLAHVHCPVWFQHAPLPPASTTSDGSRVSMPTKWRFQSTIRPSPEY